MTTASKGGPRAALSLLAAALAAGCVSDEARTQTVHDLDQTVLRQQKANDELRSRVTAAEKQLAANQAEMDRLRGRDEAYTRAREALEARLKELEGSFTSTTQDGEPGVSVERTGAGYKFVVQGEVLFGTGEADLTEEGKAALQKVVAALKGRPERLRVEGHTDNVPIAKPETKSRYPSGNLQLSLDRALTVADFLIHEGVEAKRVSCAGYGEHQPRADNGTAEGKKKNRRVEILVEAE
jgi:chemotaxis protein MotB